MALDELLTIGIPTFNRSKLLCRALKSVAGRGVQVIVSDNGSTDDTEQVMLAFPDVTYLRSPDNLGYDHNQIRIFEATHTPYLWLLGDDDQGAENWLDELEALFERHGTALDFILLNAIQLDDASPKQSSTYNLPADLLLDSLNSFYSTAAHNLTIGAVILNMREVDIALASRFAGTAHAYSAAILGSLAQRQSQIGKIGAIVTCSKIAILQSGTYKESTERFRAAVFGTTNFFSRLAQIDGLETFARKDLRCHINSVRFLFYTSRLLELDGTAATQINSLVEEVRGDLDRWQALFICSAVRSRILRRTIIWLASAAKKLKALGPQ